MSRSHMGYVGLVPTVLVFEDRTDLRQTAHADHEAVDRIADWLPFLRVEEDQRLTGTEGAKERR